MVAGFISGYLNTGKYDYALKLGAASGSATAFSYDLAKREYIDKLVNEISVKSLYRKVINIYENYRFIR
ncbi:putative 1-phosphofructokinase [Clostridioides difficile DA00165]|nr:putative 1-phosphofructokinase [Clostridioides difficile DA00165]